MISGSMELNCPRCGIQARELVGCDVCSNIGCVRCITKYNKKWVCEKCRSGQYVQSEQEIDVASAVSSMFG